MSGRKIPRPIGEDTLLPTGLYPVMPSPSGNATVDSKSETRTLVWFNVDNHFDGNTRFHGVLFAEHLGGRTTSTNLRIAEAFVAAKVGPAELSVGRFISEVGMGTAAGAPYMDGVPCGYGE